jgi:hypothetical protein
MAESGAVTFEGNILAGQSFTVSAEAGCSEVAGTVEGCVFAETANTLAGTNINGCTASANVSVSAPGPWAMVSASCPLGMLGIAKSSSQ